MGSGFSNVAKTGEYIGGGLLSLCSSSYCICIIVIGFIFYFITQSATSSFHEVGQVAQTTSLGVRDVGVTLAQNPESLKAVGQTATEIAPLLAGI
ncbi:Hypothetical protein KVN_LOCUS103 [uncultured virus]|nr:Hypothetical protein KVN_LOCUS103 [uncultured virus]